MFDIHYNHSVVSRQLALLPAVCWQKYFSTQTADYVITATTDSGLRIFHDILLRQPYSVEMHEKAVSNSCLDCLTRVNEKPVKLSYGISFTCLMSWCSSVILHFTCFIISCMPAILLCHLQIITECSFSAIVGGAHLVANVQCFQSWRSRGLSLVWLMHSFWSWQTRGTSSNVQKYELFQLWNAFKSGIFYSLCFRNIVKPDTNVEQFLHNSLCIWMQAWCINH